MSYHLLGERCYGVQAAVEGGKTVSGLIPRPVWEQDQASTCVKVHEDHPASKDNSAGWNGTISYQGQWCTNRATEAAQQVMHNQAALH